MVENVYIFVMDSLRADFLPERLAEKGVVLHSVAQSLFSAPSFATLSTGRFPQEHGVSGWRHTIAEHVPSIYDIEGRNCGFFAPADPEEEAIYSVLGRSEKVHVRDIEPPFVHLERDPLPHLPFAGADTVESYFRERGNDWARIRREYRAAIERSVDKLERRLDALEESGRLDSTLVVVTSDHGDLFGEYGCVAHTAPMTPELARVPTVVIHPDVSANDFAIDPETTVVEHVDVVETALRAASVESMPTSGTDLLERRRDRDWAYSHVEISRRGRDFYTADGIWWPEGGYAFTTNGRIDRALYAAYRLTRGSARFAQRRTPLEVFSHYVRSGHKFGTPPVSNAEARAEVIAFRETLEDVNVIETELDERTEDRLKRLGYLDT